MISHANKALTLSEKNGLQSDLAESYKFLGIADWRMGDNKAALIDYKKSLSISESINDFSGISKMLGNLSSLYRRMGKYDSALYYQRSSIKMKEALNDDRGLAISLLNIAQIYSAIGMMDSTQASFNRAFPLVEKLDEPELKIKLFLDQSYLYDEQGEMDKAISYNEYSIELAREAEIFVHLADATNNLGEIYIDLGQYEKAIDLLEESISISDRISTPQPKAIAEANLARIYLELGRLELAKKMYLNSYAVFKEFESVPDIIRTEIGLARLEMVEGNNDEAIDYLQHSLLLSNNLNDFDLSVEIIEALLKIFDARSQDPNQSIVWRDSLLVAKSRLFDQIQNANLRKLQTEFEVASMESRIKTLQLDAEIEGEKVQRFRFTSIALGVAFILALGLLYFIRRSRVVVIEKEDLKKENLKEKLEHKERELFTSTMLLIRKNEEMNQVKKQLEDISGDMKHKDLGKIIRNIDQGSRVEKDWEVFRMHFENANEGFLKRLAEKYGSLSASEVRLSTFIKMNMSNKEIAELNHVSLHAVEISRSRLRKKIGLGPGEDLFQWVQSV